MRIHGNPAEVQLAVMTASRNAELVRDSRTLRRLIEAYALLDTIDEKWMEYLLENGVDTAIHYPVPPHQQPAYKEFNDFQFPITEKVHREVLSLPISPAHTADQARVISALINDY